MRDLMSKSMEETVAGSPSEREEEREKEENVVIFLDSLDGYITLLDSLSHTLRKGWLELASARHSMGSSRISSALFNLKVQSAATTTSVSETIRGSQPELHYTLSKWGSSRDEKCLSEEVDMRESENFGSSQLRHRGSSWLSEGTQESYSANASDSSTAAVDANKIQKERLKSLAVFGTLVSPTLRSAQGSFESALETIVEIVNLRSSMLSAYSRLRKE